MAAILISDTHAEHASKDPSTNSSGMIKGMLLCVWYQPGMAPHQGMSMASAVTHHEQPPAVTTGPGCSWSR